MSLAIFLLVNTELRSLVILSVLFSRSHNCLIFIIFSQWQNNPNWRIYVHSIEEKLESEDKLPLFHKRYVDITLTALTDRYSSCYEFPAIKLGTPSNQLHDGSGKEQQTIFEWNRAHKFQS